MKRKIGQTVISFLLVLVISANVAGVYADSVSDARNELNKIKQQINENSSEISAVEDEVEGYLDEINELDSQISNYQSKLDDLQSQIDSINSQITEYQNELQNSAQLYNSAEDVYTTRLRAIYENGVPSVFEILVSSDGIGDFFSKLNVYTSVVEYDQSLIGNMKSQKEYVDYLKSNIEEGKLSLEQLSYDVEKSTNELESVKAQKQEKVDELNSSKTKLLAASKILLSQQEEANANLQSEIQKAAAAEAPRIAELQKKQQQQNNSSSNSGSSSSSKYTSSTFVWPTTSSYITAYFGRYSPLGYSTMHYGIDIGVPIGTSVFAAASGTVIIATTVTSNPYGYGGSYKYSLSAANGYGFGNYVVIAHGNSLQTLYGHLSSVAVSVGQNVSSGQVIGYSGSTGNSTGAHLHFQVNLNGSAVNPMSYFN